jgi:hypothetical protein
MSSSLPQEWNTTDISLQAPGYLIRVTGHLSADLVEWLDNGVAVQNLASGEALLYCPTGDQAALHGVLSRLRDLGLRILALQYLKPEFSTMKQETPHE